MEGQPAIIDEQVIDSRNPSANLDAIRDIVARQNLIQAGTSLESAESMPVLRETAADLGLEDIGDRVFPYFIATQLPAGVRGLLLAAIFAAAMSTVSTSLNSSATLLMSDFYKRFARPREGERSTMWVLYGGTILWGTFGTGLSLLLVRLTESALDVWWTLSGILGGGMSGLFLLGMISRRASNPGAVTGVITGVMVILWLSVPELLRLLLSLPDNSKLNQWAQSVEGSAFLHNGFLHAFMFPVVGTLVILLVGLVVTNSRNAVFRSIEKQS